MNTEYGLFSLMYVVEIKSSAKNEKEISVRMANMVEEWGQ